MRKEMESMTVQVLFTELESARESLDRALACLIPPKITKPLHSKSRIVGKSAQRRPTIKLVTENGFTIERACEREGSLADSANGCHFFVAGPHDEECRVSVGFAKQTIQLIAARRPYERPPNRVFWLRCAERHLATYLWEKNIVPPEGLLIVAQLRVEDLYMSTPFD